MTDVANAADSTPAAGSPDLSPLTQPDSNASTSSAETLNTGVNAASDKPAPDGQVPWHKDQRWQAWQKEEKALRDQAKQGDLWTRAFKEHPAFAEKVMAVIKELTAAPNQTQPQDQEALHPDPVVNKLLNKISDLEAKLSNGEKYLDQDRLEKAVSKYKGVFDELMSEAKITVLPEYEELFEQNVWRNLLRINPEIQSTYAFDREAFVQAARQEIERYQKLTNGIISGYTGQKLKNSVPQTMSGGVPLVNKPATNEAEENAFLASQIKALSGG